MARYVYIVMNEGEPVFASTEKDEAQVYADSRGQQDVDDVLDEWGNDDPDEDDIYEAAYQSGFDNGVYEVVRVNTDKADEDGEVELPDGNTINLADIEDLIESSKDADF